MSKGRQFRERLEYQLRFFVDRNRFPGRDEADAAVERARAHFIKTGRSLAGVRIEARWRNPDNHIRRHAEWKDTTEPGQSLSAFWATLGKGRGALR